jgi:hypothetical protein
MISHDKSTTRVQVEVDGYVWRVHGRQHGLRWHSHLVELLGPLPLDRPISQPLRDKIRAALAKALALDESEVVGIPEDLILA